MSPKYPTDVGHQGATALTNLHLGNKGPNHQHFQNDLQNFKTFTKSKQCLNLVEDTTLVIISTGFSTVPIF